MCSSCFCVHRGTCWRNSLVVSSRYKKQWSASIIETDYQDYCSFATSNAKSLLNLVYGTLIYLWPVFFLNKLKETCLRNPMKLILIFHRSFIFIIVFSNDNYFGTCSIIQHILLLNLLSAIIIVIFYHSSRLIQIRSSHRTFLLLHWNN
jgi:hypothetical protein